jgi:hypothetical protein
MAGRRQTKKKMPPVVTEDGLKNIALTDVRAFHRNVDWAEWWEEFYLAMTPEGTPKYKTHRAFARAKAANDLQRKFIVYLTGPEKFEDEIPPSWKHWTPMDWEHRRDTGGWYSDQSIAKLTSKIEAHNTALEALREVGYKFTMRSLIRFEKLAEQLDKEFRGRFFVDGLALSENMARAEKYMRLHAEILRLQERAQDLFARAHGINYSIDGFQTLLMGMKLTAQDNDPTQNRVGKVVNKIIEMTLSKSTTHDVPLPEAMEKAIVSIDSKKSKVN